MAKLPAVAATPDIGPRFIERATKREHYPLKLSETISLTDRVVQDTTLPLSFPDYKFPNPVVLNGPLDFKMTAEEYKEMAREHIERRILFFFQQLITSYQTKLHFEASGAQDQGESAETAYFVAHGVTYKVVRQAAHSSTLPCLIAYDQNEWAQYQAGQRAKPEGFVFLKGTDYYRTANATMNMLRWFNDTDREIDEKTVDSLLRTKGLAIVNRVSQGSLTPDEGLALFMQAALEEIDKATVRLQQQNKNPEEQAVLPLYREYFTTFQREMQNDPLFLEQFLDIKFGSHIQHSEQQKTILQIRYAAIRNNQLEQYKLIQKIEVVRKEVLAAMGARKPANFDAAFRSVLLDQARTTEDRNRLAKLYNFSAASFEAQLTDATQRTKFANLKAKISQAPHLQKIQFAVQNVLHDMRTLRTEEEYQRAQIIKDLRGMKRWQQWRLAQEVRALFPHAAASQPTISRIENRRKLVTPQIAQEFSRVFDVDSGLFMPHFFYE